jgi:hypothetical protein
MSTNIKITALNDIGSNIAYTTLVPVVDMSGTPTTKKANLQIVGNLILSGAGGSYFAPAAQAVLAQTVTNAAQPNITSVGTLTSLTVTGTANLGQVTNVKIAGGASGQVLSTDGSGNLSWVNDQSGASYSNSNVANYLPTFTGTVGANRISSNASSGSNIEMNANGAVFMFGQGGALFWPAPAGEQWVIEPNIDDEFEIKSTSNVVISTDISNTNSHFTFDSDGIFTAPSNVNLLGSRLNVGPDAATAANLLNPTLIIANTGAQYIQAAIINNDGSGSADLISYGAGGSDLEAWSDLGYAGFSFNDANYTITEPGDGYVFVQAYANGLGGNMVLATGENGNSADIVFATGGFLSSNEFARIDHSNNVFHLTRANSGIKFEDGTTQTTAYPDFDQDLNTTSNVTFSIATVGGLLTDNGYIGVADGDFLVLSPSDGNTFIQLPTTANEDSNEVLIAHENTSNGVVQIKAGSNRWSFNAAGNLTLPGNTVAINFANGASAFGNVVSVNLDGNSSNVLRGDGTFSADIGAASGANGEVQFSMGGLLSSTGNFTFTNGVDGGVIELGSTSALQLIGNGTIQNPAGNLVVTANSATWRFYDDGNLILPGNTVAINFANGSAAFGNAVSWVAAPTANTDPGTAGQAAYDAGGNLFVCVATNTWSKFSGTTSW